MNRSLVRMLTAALSVSLLAGCAPMDLSDQADDVLADRGTQPATITAVPRLPQEGSPSPWGGSNPGTWSPEARYANAVSRALNDAWQAPDTRDAVAAVALSIDGSQVFPYGDGQSNAAASFRSWTAPRPPVVATLIENQSGQKRMVLRLDRALPLASTQVTVSYVSGSTTGSTTLTAAVDGQGDRVGTWASLPAINWRAAGTGIVVRPAGWSDAWSLHFHHPSSSVDALLAEVPGSLRQFSDGRPMPDPEGISLDGARIAFDTLMSHGFGPGYNQAPFTAPDIHGSYPGRTTAVGSSWAWVASAPQAPFKQLYLCMQGRQTTKEAQFGVPTGSGWHEIGDAAESLLHTLDAEPLLAAVATPATLAPSPGGFAYGLDHVATARFLMPGEAFTTARGTDTAPRYHWYLNHVAQPVCAEIWVHPCPPTGGDGFACTAVQVTFTAAGAHTQPGQNVYVVGNVPALGAWNPANAVKLDPVFYPTWLETVAIPAGTVLEYKFIKKSSTGQVIWEGGANRTASVPYAEHFDIGGTWQ